jgi:hypothetical protein
MKRQLTSNGLYGVVAQKTESSNATDVRTSNPKKNVIHYTVRETIREHLFGD